MSTAVKELTLKLEQLHETAVKKKKTMDSEVTETLTARVSKKLGG